MSDSPKPLVCLADSQLLFERSAAGAHLGATITTNLPPVGARAAYIGAANGDEPAYFSIFEAAMDRLGVTERAFVRAAFAAADREALERADLVVLAGGDPVAGWRTFVATGLAGAIRERREAGAVLVGVSAGAVQLGWLAAAEDGAATDEPVLTFRFVPGVVGVHDEDQDWASLRRLLARSGLPLPGYGIPSGGGLLCHPDGSLEPLAKPVLECRAGVSAPAWLLPVGVPYPGSARTS